MIELIYIVEKHNTLITINCRPSVGNLEGLILNHEHQAPTDHHSTKLFAWLKTGEGGGYSNHRGNTGTETYGNSSQTTFINIY